jgi:crotonobetainyl-CoA:carnitine CoA-transferase CaiB-like acyl-CoA transferase
VTASSTQRRPPNLRGIRVVEQGQLLAVPYAARLLADLGAEVIKVESTLRLDAHRQTTYPENEPGAGFWDRGGTFYSENRGKIGLTLDLRTPDGIAIFRDLVRVSDVVMENFSTRVMRGFGLDYARLQKIRPDLIMLSSTGYGHSGPWKQYGAVGPTTEAASGLTAVTGYRDGPPMLPDIPYTDYVAAEHAVLAVLLALYRRRKTGEGAWIDLAQTETQTAIAGELIMQASIGGGASRPMGNRHPLMAPHGFFPCAGDDRWIAIAVATDDEWLRLCELMGQSDWSTSPHLTTLNGRKAFEDELELRLSAWTRNSEPFALMAALQNSGIAAGVALDGRDLVGNEHLRSRGFFTWLDHPPSTRIGRKPYPGVPWKFAYSRRGEASRAPALGEHNALVLRQILGYGEDRVQELLASATLDARPVGFPKPVPVPLHTLLDQGKVREVDPNYELRSASGSSAELARSKPDP